MPSPLFLANQKVLLTRQRHEAKKAGLHYDYRIVVGDKAYSWATKKEMPEPGKSILLFEQPVHDATYALSKEVIIPDGEYGAGRTTLEFVRKASVGDGAKDNHFSLNFDGQKLTFWKIPTDSNFYQKRMGKKADGVWMLWNRTPIEKKANMSNKYLEKIAKIAIKPSHEGLLHKDLGVPAGEKIPAGKLNAAKAAAKKSGNVAEEKRIVFAENAKKWTKSASLVKQAWDSDFEDGEYYGVSANRATGSTMVVDSLRKAAKDPKVRVQIWGDFPGGKSSYSSKEDPEGFEKGLLHIESKVPKKTLAQHDKDKTMQWHRDFSWEAGIHSKEVLPKSKYESEYDPSDTKGIHRSRVLSYLANKHGL